MGVYIGIDLHSNNSFISVVDARGRVHFEQRVENDLPRIAATLEPFRRRCMGVVVESTYNWYWLVDGLMEAGYRLHLANTAAIQQYEGMKHADDRSDARWLADMLRLKLLPEGYIYPKAERAIRDLLRKRSQLVRQKVSQMLSIQNLVSRNAGVHLNANTLKRLTGWDLDRMLEEPLVARAAKSNLKVCRCIEKEILETEKAVLNRMTAHPGWENLQGVYGVGKILGLTILLEAGDMERFASAGHFASYCRCVGSQHLSNGKKKGHGNTKNGNKWLAWAFVEAANFAVRFHEDARRYYRRKAAKTNRVVAMKAVAHKLARAVYHVLKENVPFQPERAFA
jgi:transposase